MIYSRAIKLKLKEGRYGTFADLFDYSIHKEKGYAIMFPEVAISLFHDSLGKPIVAEVSFDFDIQGKKYTVSFDELKQIEACYTALLQNLGENISSGTTKTGYVYQLEK